MSRRGITGYCLLLGLASTVLIQAHETGFPEQTLKKVFPEATGFTARKKTLTPEQIQRIEQLSGSKLQRNDNPFSYYVALGKSADGSGVLGTVVLIDARGPKGAVDLAIGFKKDGSVSRVVVVENGDDPKLSAKEFLDQFQGKNSKSPLALGQDIRYAGDANAGQSLLKAVRRGMYLLQAASGS
ncbi:MAG: hypothetical protein HY313_10780 [Acidobacteria bacterium]|nr:hypothetical protein [Acidobacteriota bacterium]